MLRSFFNFVNNFSASHSSDCSTTVLAKPIESNIDQNDVSMDLSIPKITTEDGSVEIVDGRRSSVEIIDITNKETEDLGDENSVTNDDKITCFDSSIKLDKDIQRDPGLWPLDVNKTMQERDKYLQKDSSYFQNKTSTFETSKRCSKNQNRYFSPNLFYKKLQNNEQCERKWLMFSESAGSIFCFVCKLFSMGCDNPFVKGGFSNWKKADETVSSHENSKGHNKCMMEYLAYCTKNIRIDKNIVKAAENEAQYWIKVLQRVVSVIRFLAERGLPFRGSNEVIGSANNGNFLGIIELISEYDPFLKEHLRLHANRGTGHVSYLSKTIIEEFIEALSNKVMQKIVEEIRTAKYWGLILDSTPDISHVDQLSVVIRYYLNKNVYERFLSFLQIKSHKGRSMSDNVLGLAAQQQIEIKDCRGQSYDNARNMSGKYAGVQACITEINKLAFYVG